MSKKEMESLDEQVLQVANRSGEEKNNADARQADQEEARRAKELSAKWVEEMERKAQQEIARVKMVNLLKTLAKVAACLVAAAVFLALMLEPKFWVPVIGCVGIMTFIVVGAISIDRFVQRRRRYGI
jgi:hypothetical protein